MRWGQQVKCARRKDVRYSFPYFYYANYEPNTFIPLENTRQMIWQEQFPIGIVLN